MCYDGQITERLRLAAELQDDIRHYEPPEGVDVQIYRQFCFSQLHLSILLCMGLEELEELVEYPPPFDLLLSFWSVDALLVSCKSSLYQDPTYLLIIGQFLTEAPMRSQLDPEPADVARQIRTATTIRQPAVRTRP